MQICQSASKVKKIAYSATSRYLVAASEDRSIFILDASNGHLVSKFAGHHATVRTLCMSVRGRYTATGCDDRVMRVLESETGAVLATVPHASFVTSAANTGATIASIVPHPVEEQRFFSCCDSKVLGWWLNLADATCEQTLCVQAHRSLPVTQILVAQDGAYIITVCGGEKIPLLGSGGAQQNLSAVRTEESVKVFSVSTGAHVASLLRSRDELAGPSGGSGFSQVPGVQMAALSRCERLVAVAMADGHVVMYKIPYGSFSVETTINVAPVMEYTGFQGHSTPILTSMVFTHDSSSLCIAGNERQLKLLPTAELLSGGTPSSAASAEFLTEHTITCLTVTSEPQQHDGAEFVVGDSVGRVLFIALKRHTRATHAAESNTLHE
jgi:WD40 repeat protein